MPRHHINGVELYYELTGDGDPLVLVHGGWTDHVGWQFVAPRLAESHRVVVYDRRGHSRSERLARQGSRRTDEDDLAALIEHLDLAPVHLVGNSYGGSISLGLAARRPELVRTVSAHEPPLLGVAEPGTSLGRTVDSVRVSLDAVIDDLRRGDAEGSAARFVEDVALGPGSWALLPIESQRTMVANASTCLDVFGDPAWADVPAPADRAVPVLLTDGDASPPWLPAVVAELAARSYDHAARHTFVGAGHVPHLTHPIEYVSVIRAFVVETTVAATPAVAAVVAAVTAALPARDGGDPRGIARPTALCHEMPAA